MPENLIHTTALNFAFSSGKPILKDINLQVPKGSIYGFLGPNGAGKTTTLKLVLGLIKNQQGAISIFGKDLKSERIAILQRTGTLIEQPSLYLHLTAKENLEVFRLSYQCEKKRITEVLQIVGLAETADKKVKAFSLGMKQRLAIGIAMLHDPELLILDEPTNGLDPNGIIEMRQLIIHLHEKLGKTILISSHLLSEIEKMATHVGIINKGVLLYQGSMGELTKHSRPKLRLSTSDNDKAQSILNKQYTLSTSDTGILIDVDSREMIASINKAMVESGLSVYDLSPVQFSLEDLFMQTLNA